MQNVFAPSGLVLSGLIALFILTGCAEEEPTPRLPGDQTAPFGSSSGSKSKPDAGGDDDAEDANSDEPTSCPLEPRQALDQTLQPCCFTDADCRESGAIDAHLMRCYGAVCAPNGEGVCRIPPSAPGLCWTRSDCPEGQLCRDAFIGSCEQPYLGLEVEGICH